eukprot:scaffold12741_cov171-Isochrysis_galbana.AAC.4
MVWRLPGRGDRPAPAATLDPPFPFPLAPQPYSGDEPKQFFIFRGDAVGTHPALRGEWPCWQSSRLWTCCVGRTGMAALRMKARVMRPPCGEGHMELLKWALWTWLLPPKTLCATRRC